MQLRSKNRQTQSAVSESRQTTPDRIFAQFMHCPTVKSCQFGVKTCAKSRLFVDLRTPPVKGLSKNQLARPVTECPKAKVHSGCVFFMFLQVA